MSLVANGTGVAASAPDGLTLGAGTVSAPSVRLVSAETTTGFYSPGANQIALASAGVLTWLVNAAGAQTVGPTGTNQTHTFNGSMLLQGNGAGGAKLTIVPPTGIGSQAEGLEIQRTVGLPTQRLNVSFNGGAAKFVSQEGTLFGTYSFQMFNGTLTRTIAQSDAVGGWVFGDTNLIGGTTSPGSLIVGRNNNVAVPVGYVGELMESVKTTNTTGSTTVGTLTDLGVSLTLTPGIWEVEVQAAIYCEGATGAGIGGVLGRLELTDNANAAFRSQVSGFANSEQTTMLDQIRVSVRISVTANTVVKGRFAVVNNSGSQTVTTVLAYGNAGYPITLRAVRAV